MTTLTKKIIARWTGDQLLRALADPKTRVEMERILDYLDELRWRPVKSVRKQPRTVARLT
jgi:hypothetical protein